MVFSHYPTDHAFRDWHAHSQNVLGTRPSAIADGVEHDFSGREWDFDLAPTLMSELFGCTNPPDDYSIGTNLFAGTDWQFLPIRSYFNQAIVTPTEVIVTYPGGIYEVRDRDYRPKDSLRLDKGAVEGALKAQRRFLR